MAARKRSTPEDAATARQMLLDGLAHGADIFELLSKLAPLHPRSNTFPGEVLFRLAADALDRSGPAALTRWLWRGSGSGSCPNAHSAAGNTGSSSTRSSWRQRCAAGPIRTC